MGRTPRKRQALREAEHSGVEANRYRPDIDGLRAIAVGSVILFHLGYLSGGFVGVDVFFVISGYLITSILKRELENDRFSISAFYERRIRRIFPALLFVFTVTTVLAYRYLLPGELREYARSLLAALLSGSNIFFWQQSGYFDAPSSTKPLLHTWSLAVEEQFYLFFPLLLSLVYRRAPRRIAVVLWTLAGVSLALCIALTPSSPNFSFYWPITRIWELLVGSLVAVSDLHLLRRVWLRNISSILGLVMLLTSVKALTAHIAFPGYAALLPCIGAALLVASGAHGKTMVGRLLSFKPLVSMGLISYSLYLWHWPLIVFANTGLPVAVGKPHWVVKLMIVLLSFFAAVLSWRFVERPFRRARPGSVRRRVFITAGWTAGLTALSAVVILFAQGFPDRFSAEAQSIASYPERSEAGAHQLYRLGSCFISSGNTYKDFRVDPCLKIDQRRTNYLLMGDSHAADLYYGLAQTFPAKNFLQATVAGCRPTLEPTPGAVHECELLNQFIFKSFLPNHPVSYVILSARWAPSDLKRLGATISYLKQLGVKTIIVGPCIEYDTPLPRLLAISIDEHDAHLPARHRLASFAELDEAMSNEAAQVWHVPYLSFFPILCPGSNCLTMLPNNVPLQDDTDHFSVPGSVYVSEQWRRANALP